MGNKTSFQLGNKLAVDSKHSRVSKDKSTKQRATEAIAKNRDRIPEFLDELHSIYTNERLSQKDRMEARKLWAKTMESVAKILEKTDKTSKLEITDAQLIDIVIRVQKLYRERTQSKSEGL